MEDTVPVFFGCRLRGLPLVKRRAQQTWRGGVTRELHLPSGQCNPLGLHRENVQSRFMRLTCSKASGCESHISM